MRISVYSPELRSQWDKFVDSSKNGTFLFKRDYMEYHSDRFIDCSIVFHGDDDRLLALMPACIKDGVVTSHAGLTFGGIVTDERMKAGLMLEVFEALKSFLREMGATKLVYKAVPHIYHRYPAEEDLYGLFRSDARLVRRDISSAIANDYRLPLSKGRKYAVKQARRVGLIFRKSHDFRSFMNIEEDILAKKYNTKPTHSTLEIETLAARFPENIKLFGAFDHDVMTAGVIVYEHRRVAHTQYIATTDQGKISGALDLIVDNLVNEVYNGKEYFDFGISTESLGTVLNLGLIENKQSYGARAIAHDFYELLI